MTEQATNKSEAAEDQPTETSQPQPAQQIQRPAPQPTAPTRPRQPSPPAAAQSLMAATQHLQEAQRLLTDVEAALRELKQRYAASETTDYGKGKRHR